VTVIEDVKSSGRWKGLFSWTKIYMTRPNKMACKKGWCEDYDSSQESVKVDK